MRATTKKTLASKVASTKTTKSQATQAVAAPPAWIFPTRPNGFVPPTAAVVRRRSKPTEDMRTAAVNFAAELRSGTTYADDFGKRAPEPTALADTIDIATQWDDVYEAVAPVAEYALAMRGAAWDVALKPVKKLQGEYESAVADEPTLAKTWRQTTAFFGAREEPAQRAVQTKQKAKKAAKKAGKGNPPKA